MKHGGLALVAITLGVPSVLIVLTALGVSKLVIVFLAIPALALVWASAGICSFIWSVRSAVRKAWRRSFFALILPVILVFVALNPLQFLHACDRIGRTARFAVTKPAYDRQIAALPANQRPRLIVFTWDGFLSFSNGLLYDETDQIRLPRDRRSSDWLAQAGKTELICSYSADPLWDHYYFINFSC